MPAAESDDPDRILLHGPTLTNDGRYVDSGVVLVVGTDDDQVHVDRIEDLVDAGAAVDAGDAEPTPEADFPEPSDDQRQVPEPEEDDSAPHDPETTDEP